MGESNDCVVVSLAYAIGLPYKAAHLVAFRSGRKDCGCGSMLKVAGILEQGIMERVTLPDNYYITLAEFCREHPRGRYWVGVTGHALVVENGRICDHSEKPRRRVDMAWRVLK